LQAEDGVADQEVKDMTRVENSTSIRASTEEIGQYIWDVNKLPSYMPISDVEVLDSREDFVKIRHKFTAAGRTMDLVCEAKWVEKNRREEYRTTEGMKLVGTWLLDPADEATRLKNIIDYEPPGGVFGKLLDRMKIRREMTRIQAESLGKLKETLEGRK